MRKVSLIFRGERKNELTELGLSGGGEVEVDGISGLVSASDGGSGESGDREGRVGRRASGDESGGDAEREREENA